MVMNGAICQNVFDIISDKEGGIAEVEHPSNEQ
jgi:hypothetical protein